MDHRNRIHDPGHGLRVGVHIRRGNVAIRADDGRNFKRIPASEPFELSLRHALRITDHTALATAVGNADGRALPRHPRGEGLNFIERDVWMVTNASLGWAARNVVLHTITLEDFCLATVHAHRN